MTKSKNFWAVLAVISLAAAGFSGYSVYARLAVQFANDTVEIGPASAPQAKEIGQAKEEPAGPPPAVKKPGEEPRKQKAVKTAFEYKSASAKNVTLSGTFTKWKATPMIKRNGVWKSEIYILPGNYLYHFTSDGKKTPDPDKAKSPSGESIAVVEAPNTNDPK